MGNKAKIRLFILGLLQRRGDTRSLGDQDSLILSGRLDSMNLLEIVGFLEQEFNFDMSGLDFEESLFDTLDNISTLV